MIQLLETLIQVSYGESINFLTGAEWVGKINNGQCVILSQDPAAGKVYLRHCRGTYSLLNMIQALEKSIHSNLE